MDNRLAFVTHEYRTDDKSDLTIRAKYPNNARIVSLQTNLDSMGALRRLNEEMALGGGTRAFELKLEQIFIPDDFIGGPPSFAIYSPADNLNGDVLTAFAVSTDLQTGVSTLKVR